MGSKTTQPHCRQRLQIILFQIAFINIFLVNIAAISLLTDKEETHSQITADLVQSDVFDSDPIRLRKEREFDYSDNQLFTIIDGENDVEDNAVQTLPADAGLSNMKEARIMKDGPALERQRRAQTVRLRTSLGMIFGTVETSNGITLNTPGRTYYAFRGIPYAKPPIRSLRFADPVNLASTQFEGSKLDATRFQNFCPQFDHDKKIVVGNEDCLYLNIYTPQLTDSSNRSSRLPVLVFIHGGAYTRGSSSPHGAGHLMREDIVLVTINYRLGVLGLLSTNDHEMPGNYAALDQISALKWVRRNIQDYHGDPEAITLGGFSAGASYVHLHMISPLSQGLFSKAIIASGAANCLWSVQTDHRRIAEELGKDLGCSVSSSAELKQCLLLTDAETILKSQTSRTRYVYWPLEFRPIVDAGLRPEPFLPATVEELHRRPLPSTVPVLIGGTPEEGLLFALTVLLFSPDPSSPSKVYDSSANYLFGSLWPNETSRESISSSLVSFYYSQTAQKDVNVLISEMTDALTDLLFMSCIWDAAENFAKAQMTVYTYLMTHHEPGSPSFGAPLYRVANKEGVTSPLLQHGVSHGDDIALLFTFPYDLGTMGIRDMAVSRILTTTWGNFIRTGSPQELTSGTSGPPTWKPLDPGGPVNYYRISLSPAMMPKPYRNKERNFWQQTLPIVERLSDTIYLSTWWQISTWVLLALLLVILLCCLITALCFHEQSKKRKYSREGAHVTETLTSIPEKASVGEMTTEKTKDKD